MFKSVGFDATVRPSSVSAVILVPVDVLQLCPALNGMTGGNSGQRQFLKQEASRICILKNCSEFLEMTENFPMSWSCWINISGLVVAVLEWIVVEKQQQYWVSLLSAAMSNLCSFFFFSF